MTPMAPNEREGILPIKKYKYKLDKHVDMEVKGSSVSIDDPTLKQGYLGNLLNKSKEELEMLVLRQDKLINDSNFMSRLPDKGAKILSRKAEIQKALQIISAKGKKADKNNLPDTVSMEWQWRNNENKTASSKQGKKALDSDDDEDEVDPLRLIATHSIDTPSTKTQKSEKADDELDPAEVIKKELENLEICDSVNQLGTKSSDKMETTVSDVSDLSKVFCDKLLLQYETKCKQNTIKTVYKPCKSLKAQGIKTRRDSNTVFSSSFNKNNSQSQSSSENNSTSTTTEKSLKTGEPISPSKERTCSPSTFTSTSTPAPTTSPSTPAPTPAPTSSPSAPAPATSPSTPTSTNSVPAPSTPAPAGPQFGGAAVFPPARPRTAEGGAWHASSLWRDQSSATGPLLSFGEEARKTQLLGVRESMALERAAHERSVETQRGEQARRLARGPQPRRYRYRDVNEQKLDSACFGIMDDSSSGSDD